MPDADRLELARDAYRAYETRDRSILERLLSEVYFGWDLD
jgi:hypothetical protein